MEDKEPKAQNTTTQSEPSLPEAVAEAKKAGKRVLLISDGEMEFYFARPTKAAVKRFQDDVSRSKGKASGALEQFVLGCAVHPDRKRLQEVFEEEPGIVPNLADRLHESVGGDREFEVKNV